MDLPDFLLARIAEDAAVARAAMPGPWLAGARDGAVASKFSTAEHGSHDASTFAVMLPGPEVWNPATAMANATHIARHDPARVLAECDAKRRIVELHCEYPTPNTGDVMRLLALPYADHPDYREEWRP